MAQPHRIAMSNVDKAWLEMDSPTNLMIINGVMLFDEVLDFESFKSIVETRLVQRFRRFRQRIVDMPSNPGRLYWEDDPYFDIRSHIRHIALPAPGDTTALQTLISDLMSSPLDRQRPLWRFYLIENVNGGCAVFGRIHHCIADGIALIQVLLSLTDSSPEGQSNTQAALFSADPSRSSQSARSNGFEPFAPIFSLVRSATKIAAKVAKIAVTQGMETIENPVRLIEMAQSAGLLTAASAAILTKLLILPPDRQSVFKGELSTLKRVVWSEPIDLEMVKAIGKNRGATINDVLVAGVTGALRRYLLQHGDSVRQGEIRAMVPVNLRDPKQDLHLGNQFALVYLNLPVSIAEPNERLAVVKRQMDLLKSSPEPLIVYQVLNLIGMLPMSLAEKATAWFSTKASAVLTNVPGPRQTLYFNSIPLRRIMFWVPQSGQIGLGISIISYAGAVSLGLIVDEKLAADPEKILGCFDTEIKQLAHL
jgi:WS/DGAT/MGAT family acyltransferase